MEKLDERTAELEKPTADIQQLVAEITVLDEEILALDTMKVKATAITDNDVECKDYCIDELMRVKKTDEIRQKDFYADDLSTNQLETEQKDHEKSKEFRDADLGDRRACGSAW